MERVHPYNDPQLVGSFLNRDHQSFRLLVNTWFPVLCHFAFGIVKDEELAKDIVQEVFTRYWNGDEKFEAFNQLKAWLYQSTRNRSLNELRSRVRQENHHLTAQQHTEVTEAGILASIVRSETLAAIYAVVNTMPEQMRTVFELHFMEGMPVREIAEKLGIASKTVSNHRYNALNLLRSRLASNADALVLLMMLFNAGEKNA